MDLRKEAPVIYSRRFWGLCLYVLLGYLQSKGWIGGEEVHYFSQLVALSTGVGVIDSVARKVGDKKG